MDPNLRTLVAAAERANWTDELAASRPSRFSVELDRRGLFLRLGRTEFYLCAEAERAWGLYREPGGFDLHLGRLHLVAGRSPR